ncbi:MAG: hypothetical protein IT291_07355 [Deltaproteobacteria bacterium]|nr:hypothetical protein [Deltaproteobacteria bacterium]
MSASDRDNNAKDDYSREHASIDELGRPIEPKEPEGDKRIDKCPDSHKHVFLNRHWRSQTVWIVAYLICCFFAIVLSQSMPGLDLAFDIDILGNAYLVEMPLLGIVPPILLARPFFLIYDEFAELACHHLRVASGLCSLRKIEYRIAYEDMVRVSVEQTLLARILKIGTLCIGTAVRDHSEIKIEGLANPQYYASLITGHIDEARISLKSVHRE